jgi:thiazole synthase ThiGH ThiG subunit
VGPFGFCDGAFDNHMVDLLVVIVVLPLIVKVGVGASSDGENCAVGGEVVILLWRLIDL